MMPGRIVVGDRQFEGFQKHALAAAAAGDPFAVYLADPVGGRFMLMTFPAPDGVELFRNFDSADAMQQALLATWVAGNYEVSFLTTPDLEAAIMAQMRALAAPRATGQRVS